MTSVSASLLDAAPPEPLASHDACAAEIGRRALLTRLPRERPKSSQEAEVTLLIYSALGQVVRLLDTRTVGEHLKYLADKGEFDGLDAVAFLYGERFYGVRTPEDIDKRIAALRARHQVSLDFSRTSSVYKNSRPGLRSFAQRLVARLGSKLG